jgi:hypothetical protein
MPRNTLRPRKPRTGAVELTLMRPAAGRPEPPTDLDPDEAQIWVDVIDSLPSHWIDPAGQLLLRGIVAQAAIARRQEARLRRLQAGSNDDADADGLAIAQPPASSRTPPSRPRASPRSRALSITKRLYRARGCPGSKSCRCCPSWRIVQCSLAL